MTRIPPVCANPCWGLWLAPTTLLQVPLLFTVYLMISFNMFEIVKKAPEPEFFEVRAPVPTAAPHHELIPHRLCHFRCQRATPWTECQGRTCSAGKTPC